jgi:hypothetical protein
VNHLFRHNNPDQGEAMSGFYSTVSASTWQSRPLRFIKTTFGYKSIPQRHQRRLRFVNRQKRLTVEGRLSGLAAIAARAGLDTSAETIRQQFERIPRGQRRREMALDAEGRSA